MSPINQLDLSLVPNIHFWFVEPNTLGERESPHLTSIPFAQSRFFVATKSGCFLSDKRKSTFILTPDFLGRFYCIYRLHRRMHHPTTYTTYTTTSSNIRRTSKRQRQRQRQRLLQPHMVLAALVVVLLCLASFVQAQEFYTLDQVASHNSPHDCWSVLHNQIWDLTGYAPIHPGNGGGVRISGFCRSS